MQWAAVNIKSMWPCFNNMGTPDRSNHDGKDRSGSDFLLYVLMRPLEIS